MFMIDLLGQIQDDMDFYYHQAHQVLPHSGSGAQLLAFRLAPTPSLSLSPKSIAAIYPVTRPGLAFLLCDAST